MTVYATSPLIGSPSKMYDMLVESAQKVIILIIIEMLISNTGTNF